MDDIAVRSEITAIIMTLAIIVIIVLSFLFVFYYKKYIKLKDEHKK